MKQKIEWYQEVLDLEPGSKVFFPLARMQAEDGQAEAALATLRHGLSRNPEHIEARLLLIDLLFSAGKLDTISPEVDQLSIILGGYPGFWAAWTQRMAKNPASRDTALALNFLSANLNGHSLTWSDVIEKGLLQLLPGVDPGLSSASVTPAIEPFAIDELHKYLKDEDKSDLSAGLTTPSLPVADEHDELDGDDEHFSLKTRSMAEVLAEQGDLSGALDIYEELLQQAATEEEKISLQTAIAELSSRIGSAGQVPPAKKAEEPQGGNNRLLSVLDALAQRLEARS